jgi:phosphoribosyl-ATP pyrophosphohydrolase
MKKLLPAIIQDYVTGRILMLGYMNQEAIHKTQLTGWVYFWSRSRQELWLKGATSGNKLKLKNIFFDCDGDAVLCLVQPTGPTCHTGNISCFTSALEQLATVLQSRRKTMPQNSYSASLFRKGLKAINAKITEEASEVTRAASCETKKRLIEEVADLWFHSLVLGIYKNISLTDIEAELKKRLNARATIKK